MTNITTTNIPQEEKSPYQKVLDGFNARDAEKKKQEEEAKRKRKAKK